MLSIPYAGLCSVKVANSNPYIDSCVAVDCLCGCLIQHQEQIPSCPLLGHCYLRSAKNFSVAATNLSLTGGLSPARPEVQRSRTWYSGWGASRIAIRDFYLAMSLMGIRQ